MPPNGGIVKQIVYKEENNSLLFIFLRKEIMYEEHKGFNCFTIVMSIFS